MSCISRVRPLTAEVLNRLYRELNDLYYEGAVNNPLRDVEWARIPILPSVLCVPVCHRFLLGCSHRQPDSGNRRCIGLSEIPGHRRSMYPIDELKIAGVDLTSPETVGSALQVFSGKSGRIEECIGDLD